MWQNPSCTRPRADVLALQLNAERAGLAWACPFSSSDEFEAAVISSKRRADAFGRKRLRRHMLLVVAAAVAVAVACLLA
jgi:hypothetical protein